MSRLTKVFAAKWQNYAHRQDGTPGCGISNDNHPGSIR